MIHRVVIVNFQRHRKLDLKLGRNTTIIGSTDVGKSAVMRAIRWVCLNDLRGTDFIREGAKRCRVTLYVDEHKVSRIRGASINVYRLDGKTFHAVGTGVPQEVREVLNIEEYNFQSQHDGPFWFNLPGPAVSRALNDVVDLSLIDHTLAQLGKALRRDKVELGVVSERLAEATKVRTDLQMALVLQEMREGIQARKVAIEDGNKKAALLSTIVTAGEEAAANLKRLGKPLQKGSDAMQGAQHLIEAEARITLLDQMIDYGTRQQQLAGIRLPSTKTLSTTALAHTRLERKAAKLRSAITRAEEAQDALQKATKELDSAESKFHEAIGEVCPLCGASQ